MSKQKKYKKHLSTMTIELHYRERNTGGFYNGQKLGYFKNQIKTTRKLIG